jgi:probable rRNA maturation factor
MATMCRHFHASYTTMPNTIHFFFTDTKYNLAQRTLLRNWITTVAKKNGKSISNINFIFCSDEYLLQINRDHLKHDYYTDIITFDLSLDKHILSDIYISVDRVRDNAKKNNSSIKNEMHRVMIHGVLHLCGYKDKSHVDKKIMTNKEDISLALLHKMSSVIC